MVTSSSLSSSGLLSEANVLRVTISEGLPVAS